MRDSGGFLKETLGKCGALEVSITPITGSIKRGVFGDHKKKGSMSWVFEVSSVFFIVAF